MTRQPAQEEDRPCSVQPNPCLGERRDAWYALSVDDALKGQSVTIDRA